VCLLSVGQLVLAVTELLVSKCCSGYRVRLLRVWQLVLAATELLVSKCCSGSRVR
jgi:hypothetical protein